MFALTSVGSKDWDVEFSGRTAGNRSALARADVDRDGRLDVIEQIEATSDIDFGGLVGLNSDADASKMCFGAPKLAPGRTYRVGLRSPALADVDGDGALEIVYLGVNGVIYAVDSAWP